MAHDRHAALPRVADTKRDLDVLLAMLVRADIGFVLNQSGPVTTVELIVEPVPELKPLVRPVFRFTKVGGAMRGFGLEDMTAL
jgi:hypothetical protein